MINPPCKDCPDRTVGCHAGCEKYKAFRDQQMEQAERKAASRKELWMFRDVQRPQSRVWDRNKRQNNDLTKNRTK